MRAMKALSANYFLDPLLQTFPTAYYTCLGHKIFTFQLPGKCGTLNFIDSKQEAPVRFTLLSKKIRILRIPLSCHHTNLNFSFFMGSILF